MIFNSICWSPCDKNLFILLQGIFYWIDKSIDMGELIEWRWLWLCCASPHHHRHCSHTHYSSTWSFPNKQISYKCGDSRCYRLQQPQCGVISLCCHFITFIHIIISHHLSMSTITDRLPAFYWYTVTSYFGMRTPIVNMHSKLIINDFN